MWHALRRFMTRRDAPGPPAHLSSEPSAKSASSGRFRFGRRAWLKGMAVAASIAGVGGAVALVRTEGYELESGIRDRLRTLDPAQYIVVRALARRIVAPDVAPGLTAAPSPDDVGVTDFVDGYLESMRPDLRRDFLRMLQFVEQLAPLGSGLLSRFSSLSAFDQDRVLASLEQSRVGQLRAGFQAIKSVIMLGYYRDPRTFRILGYGGPLLSGQEQTP